MKVYKVFYAEEYEHPDDIEIIKEGSLVKYVNYLIKEGRISAETLELFNEERPHGLQTETDAIELLESDGYWTAKISVFE